MKKKETKVNVSYFFKKIKDTVYKFTRIGDGEWEADKTPYKAVPYIYWSDKELHKTGGRKK